MTRSTWQQMPGVPHDPPIYERRYVAYLDVLGFRDLTIKADKDESLRNFIQGALTDIDRLFPNFIHYRDFQRNQFSDTVVMSNKVCDGALLQLMMNCVILVRRMLAKGILVRGGLAVGNMFQAGSVLYGLAYLEALNFDTRGGPPKISFSSELLAEIEGSWLANWTCADPRADEPPMLHTLAGLNPNRGSPGPVHWTSPTIVEVRTKIQEVLSNPSLEKGIKDKWLWLSAYVEQTMSEERIVS